MSGRTLKSTEIVRSIKIKVDRCVRIKAGKGTHLPPAEQAFADKSPELCAIGDITP
jgi:hypothetical protein